MGAAIADDPLLIRAHLRDSLSQTNTDILRTVVEVDFMVAFALDRAIKKAVHRKKRQHMIEEGIARRHTRDSLSLNGKFAENIRLLRGAFHRGFPGYPNFHRPLLSIIASRMGARCDSPECAMAGIPAGWRGGRLIQRHNISLFPEQGYPFFFQASSIQD
jgi:hypothetical protein